MDEDGFTDTAAGVVQAGAGVVQAAAGVVQATPATAHGSQAVPPRVDAGAPGHNVPRDPIPNEGNWTTSLFACFEDTENCRITSVSPCITFGHNAEIIDRGNTRWTRAATLCCLLCNLFYCSFSYTYTYRTKLRGFYSIPGDQCGDCFVHLLCQPCAICQEYRELRNRGFEPANGWVVNQERRTQQARTMDPPSVPGSMIR